MQTKNISIVLFILIFTGVALLGSTQVWAQWGSIQLSAQCDSCSTSELAGNTCIEAYGYAIRIYPENGEWPIVHGDGTLEFRYKGCVVDPSACKGLTVNYIVQDLTACPPADTVDYIAYTDPPGANLLLPGQTVPKCTWFTAPPGHNLLKLNPSLNCQKGAEVVFSFFAEPGTPTSLCNYTVIATKKGCEGGYLLGPGCGGAPYAYVEERVFYCEDIEVTVRYDQCSGKPTSVTMKNYYVCHTTLGDDDHPHFAIGENPYSDSDHHPAGKVGPRGIGCLICPVPPPPIYLYGDEAWYGSTDPCPDSVGSEISHRRGFSGPREH